MPRYRKPEDAPRRTPRPPAPQPPTEPPARTSRRRQPAAAESTDTSHSFDWLLKHQGVLTREKVAETLAIPEKQVYSLPVTRVVVSERVTRWCPRSLHRYLADRTQPGDAFMALCADLAASLPAMLDAATISRVLDAPVEDITPVVPPALIDPGAAVDRRAVEWLWRTSDVLHRLREAAVYPTNEHGGAHD